MERQREYSRGIIFRLQHRVDKVETDGMHYKAVAEDHLPFTEKSSTESM